MSSSPLVGLGSGVFIVVQGALKVVSCKLAKHEKACIDNQQTFIPFAFDIFDEHSALKAGLRKVKIFKEYVSIKRCKKASSKDDNEISESRSDEGDYSNSNSNLVDSESGDDYDESERYSPENDLTASSSEQSITQILKRSILPWKKRKLNFKSPPKGEPLLKKDYGEESGYDIDFDRRQLSSDESLVNLPQVILPAFEFGDDSFVIRNWEQREIIFGLRCVDRIFFGTCFLHSEARTKFTISSSVLWQENRIGSGAHCDLRERKHKRVVQFLRLI
ncbi:unnamed protein product [Lactuca saligna]|uniref:Uncharacterized protein n=1 Tax=Lactuca saligna TaxID=75948 RepID=A0AA35ZHD1_LACSI|nr:unnamed protein product [Lactuca saligna]